ncbi:hypothetical protein COLO4_06160 [Corchorus olitorius]|uniref:Uncharacterized protein n=1 Tax=Corchorus olitorius TaxID=93759 RepID=A0A1R3KNT4_9ROSI|nr:hypothetical protein COLO4_06160 [Corchorus olitorius]
MAYRRRQGISRASTFKEEIHHPPDDDKSKNFASYSFSSSNSPAASLAAQAIRASSASHKTDSPASDFDSSRSKEFNAYEDAKNDSKGFWGVLARKAKAILDDDNMSEQLNSSGRMGSSYGIGMDASTASQNQQTNDQGFRRMDNPALRRGLDKLTTSLNQIGDTFEKAFEEGRTMVENKTQDIIQETRKLQIRRKGSSPMGDNQFSPQPMTQPTHPQNHETQLKASRDVAMATAAKAKLLLRELKTVKADLAFAKERCAQLEEENKLLRESREKGGNPADDDLIRLQLETLLAEKARLAHENEIYARENRFLREIVEYHQLTMQDVVYLDEGAEEVTEVYPLSFSYSKVLSDDSPSSPKSPMSPSEEVTPCTSPEVTKESLPLPIPPPPDEEAKEDDVPLPPNNSSPSPSLPDDQDKAKRPPLDSL